MADEKKAPPKNTTLETLIGIIFILMVVAAILERLRAVFTGGDLTFFGFSLSEFWQDFRDALPALRIISYAISGLFAFGIITFSQMRGTIWIAERKKMFPEGEESVPGGAAEVKNPMADRWQQILGHVESEHPSDWRLAIIEADILLQELVDRMNLPGDTIGDKLKAVEPSDFITLDQAWEAHKVRNQIAHEGSEFLLNQREARRVIGLYEQVFQEFGMI